MWTPLDLARITLGSRLAGEDVNADTIKIEKRGTAANITTATTTTIKAAPGHINEIRVAGGVLGAVTVYDNVLAAGDVIVPAVTPIQGQVLIKDVEFSVGLTIVTAAATILTISYR